MLGISGCRGAGGGVGRSMSGDPGVTSCPSQTWGYGLGKSSFLPAVGATGAIACRRSLLDSSPSCFAYNLSTQSQVQAS